MLGKKRSPAAEPTRIAYIRTSKTGRSSGHSGICRGARPLCGLRDGWTSAHRVARAERLPRFDLHSRRRRFGCPFGRPSGVSFEAALTRFLAPVGLSA